MASDIYSFILRQLNGAVAARLPTYGHLYYVGIQPASSLIAALQFAFQADASKRAMAIYRSHWRKDSA